MPRAFLWSCGDFKVCQEYSASSCEPSISSACGCDGEVYESDCAAYAAGTELDGYSPGCAAPSGTFPCGFTFCESGQELCVERYERGWTCQPLPESCRGDDPSCDCISSDGGVGGAGGASTGAGGASASDEWAELLGDRRCQECVVTGPGLRVNCGAQ